MSALSAAGEAAGKFHIFTSVEKFTPGWSSHIAEGTADIAPYTIYSSSSSIGYG